METKKDYEKPMFDFLPVAEDVLVATGDWSEELPTPSPDDPDWWG